MALALHRSLTFWAGIFVIVALSLGWIESMRGGTSVGGDGFSMVNIRGGILAEFSPRRVEEFRIRRDLVLGDSITPERFPAPFVVRGQGDRFWEEPKRALGEQAPVLESYLREQWAQRPLDWRGWFVPYWCLLLVAGLAWVALLLWRARRRRLAPSCPKAS